MHNSFILIAILFHKTTLRTLKIHFVEKLRNLILWTKKWIIICWTKIQNEFSKFDFECKKFTKSYTMCLCLLNNFVYSSLRWHNVCEQRSSGVSQVLWLMQHSLYIWCLLLYVATSCNLIYNNAMFIHSHLLQAPAAHNIISSMDVYLHTLTYSHIYTHPHTHAHTYIHAYIYKYIYIYIRTYML